MPSLFERRFQQRSVPILNRTFAVDVQIQRGAQISEAFKARRNEFQHQTIGAEYGLEVKITMREFVFAVSDCVIFGEEIEPRTGDRIIEGSTVFEIQPPDKDTPSVKLADGSYEYRVYTKQVE